MDREIAKALKEQGGILSVCELADLLDLAEGKVRRWARDPAHAVRRIGSTFAFTEETAFALADDLLAADDEDEDFEHDEDEDLDEEEDDAGDDDEDEDDDDED